MGLPFRNSLDFDISHIILNFWVHGFLHCAPWLCDCTGLYFVTVTFRFPVKTSAHLLTNGLFFDDAIFVSVQFLVCVWSIDSKMNLVMWQNCLMTRAANTLCSWFDPRRGLSCTFSIRSFYWLPRWRKQMQIQTVNLGRWQVKPGCTDSSDGPLSSVYRIFFFT